MLFFCSFKFVKRFDITSMPNFIWYPWNGNATHIDICFALEYIRKLLAFITTADVLKMQHVDVS